MTEATALAARELRLLGRSALGGLLLTAFGLVTLFILCGAADRYRLLADLMLLRKVALPMPVMVGLWLSYLSFWGEMREGTWDNLMLLPCPRRTVLVVKGTVGLLLTAASLAVPMLALKELLGAIDATGGPILTTKELLLHSLLGRGLLLGALSYLAGAAASFLARDGRAAAVAPLAAPILFGMQWFGSEFRVGSIYAGPSFYAAGALVVAWSALLFLEIAQVGRRPSGWLLAARALLPTPLLLTLLVFLGLAVQRRASRGSDAEAVPEGPEESALIHGITEDGRLLASKNTDDFASMYVLNPRDPLKDPRHEPLWPPRYWSPAYSGDHLQLFLRKDRHELLAYDANTGLSLGCIGVDGLRPSNCAPFEGEPTLHNFDRRILLVTPSRLFSMSHKGQRLVEIYQGRAVSTVNMGAPGQRGRSVVAMQVEQDLILVGEPSASTDGEGEPGSPDEPGDQPEEREAEPSAPPTPAPLQVQVACRDAARWGPLARVHGGEHFFGVESKATDGSEHLIVCRGGEVQEHLRAPPESAQETPETPEKPSRYLLTLSILAGPAFSELIGRHASTTIIDHHYKNFGAAMGSTRAHSRGVALLGAALLGWLARWPRWAPRSAPALAAACALLLGPAYVLSYLLLLWRRSWPGGLSS